MENLCYFVNSRGLLKSCNFHSNTPKSSCNDDKNYLYFMLLKMFDGMSVYVCSDLLIFFVTDILPKINKRFVLVSGDSDICVPKEAVNYEEFNKLIQSPYLIKWLVQNTQIQYINKMIQLPIGVDYHTISNDPDHQWKLPDESHLPGAQERVLINIKEKSNPFYERIPNIYVNFSVINDRFGDREDSLKNIPSELLIINDTFTPRTNNWNNIVNYTFVLSPFGNGMDCHRTWEALCLGCIPIIMTSALSRLFVDLPVLIVDDWTQITEKLLIDTLVDFKNRQLMFDKLKMSYWLEKIKGV